MVYQNWPIRHKSSFYLPVTTKSASATLTKKENGLVIVDTDAVTLTLPAASGNSGLRYDIKVTCSVSTGITIDGNASETIDGQTTLTLSTQYEVNTIVCDGSNWHII